MFLNTFEKEDGDQEALADDRIAFLITNALTRFHDGGTPLMGRPRKRWR
jgi:hypothetical protein